MAAKKDVETTEYLKMVRRMIRRAGERVGDADEHELRELLALHEAVDAALVVAVAGQRSTGRSWEAIAAGTQTTRQAAFARFAAKTKQLSA